MDELHRVNGEGYNMHVNLKNEGDGKVWFVHSEPEISGRFWEVLDRPRGGYKEMSGKTVTYKAKIGDDSAGRLFEEEPVIPVAEGKSSR